MSTTTQDLCNALNDERFDDFVAGIKVAMATDRNAINAEVVRAISGRLDQSQDSKQVSTLMSILSWIASADLPLSGVRPAGFYNICVQMLEKRPSGFGGLTGHVGIVSSTILESDPAVLDERFLESLELAFKKVERPLSFPAFGSGGELMPCLDACVTACSINPILYRQKMPHRALEGYITAPDITDEEVSNFGFALLCNFVNPILDKGNSVSALILPQTIVRLRGVFSSAAKLYVSSTTAADLNRMLDRINER
jgi:hypothetical protein